MSRPGGAPIPYGKRVTQARWDSIFPPKSLKDKAERRQGTPPEGDHPSGKPSTPSPDHDFNPSVPLSDAISKNQNSSGTKSTAGTKSTGGSWAPRP
jgi:hypothetical protein